MDRVIKIKATKIQSASEHLERYLIQIIKQTYIRGAFGNPDNSFTSSKGFILRSVNNPATASANKLFVRGDATYGNNYELSIPADYLIKVMHAVREYNSHLIIKDLPSIPDEESFVID